MKRNILETNYQGRTSSVPYLRENHAKVVKAERSAPERVASHLYDTNSDPIDSEDGQPFGYSLDSQISILGYSKWLGNIWREGTDWKKV